MAKRRMTYASTGVDYDSMDPFKIKATKAASATDAWVKRFGFSVASWSRGESAFLIETPMGYIAFVVEGLGTKNLVADALYKLAVKFEQFSGKSFYSNIAQCCVAMIVNDMLTLGALPITLGQYLAVGESKWFANEKRSTDLVHGWKNACDLARCTWGGGETPTLKGVIEPRASDLAGAAMGIVTNKKKVFNPAKICHGDQIIFLGSSGIHANGLTMARTIASKLRKGYRTELPDGRTYGETLLDPTHIYVGFVEDCIKAGVDIHYAVNITGHGWRKLMRARQPFAYIIDSLPEKPVIFDFIQKHGNVSPEEMYGNFNMGAGFALYIPQKSLTRFTNFVASTPAPFRAYNVGSVQKSSKKKVVIIPEVLEYSANTLAVR